MSDVGRRGVELQAQLDALMTEIEPVEIVRLTGSVKALADARVAALTAIEAVVCDEGSEPLADELREKEDYARDQYLVPLAKLLDGLRDPTPALELWVEGQATIEARFFAGLQALELGVTHDALIALDAKLAELIDKLERKWATMSEENQRIEAIEAAASDEMTKIVRNALDEGTAWWARWGDAFNTALTHFMKIPDEVNETVVIIAIQWGVPERLAKLLPKISLVGKDTFATAKELGVPAKEVATALEFLMRDAGMAVSETIQRAYGREFEALITILGAIYKNALPLASEAYSRQVSALQSLMPNQGSILVSFSQTRADVEQFLRENGLDKVRAIYESATAGLDRWADAQGTDALRADARAMAREIKLALQKRAERTTRAFEEFVRAHSGRFVGRVERDTEEALLWTGLWTRREDGIKQLGMDEKLRTWLGETMRVTASFDDASRQVRSKLAELSPDIRDSITSKLDAYFATLREQLSTAVQQATTTMDAAQRAVAPDQITRDYDRSARKQRLYA